MSTQTLLLIAILLLVAILSISVQVQVVMVERLDRMEEESRYRRPRSEGPGAEVVRRHEGPGAMWEYLQARRQERRESGGETYRRGDRVILLDFMGPAHFGTVTSVRFSWDDMPNLYDVSLDDGRTYCVTETLLQPLESFGPRKAPNPENN